MRAGGLECEYPCRQSNEELKREPCDQKSIGDLALLLDKLGYRREAADALYRFVKDCGAPLYALNQSANIYLKLTDYAKAVEVADELVRRVPSDSNARYLRGVALDGIGDFQRALADYSDAIELYGSDKKRVSSRVFLRMAGVADRQTGQSWTRLGSVESQLRGGTPAF